MNVLEKFKDINTFIFDVDGVLTDSTLIVTEKGELLRTMNAKDGYAMRKAIDEDFLICIITGGKSEGVALRLEGLGITEIYSGISDKVECYHKIIEKYDVNPEHILYMGDDLPDYEVMRLVGLPTCPSDSVPEIKSVSQYISPIKGGYGCVRDVIEKVLKLQGCWLNTPFKAI